MKLFPFGIQTKEKISPVSLPPKVDKVNISICFRQLHILITSFSRNNFLVISVNFGIKLRCFCF